MFLICQLLRQLITEISKKKAISLLSKENSRSPGLVNHNGKINNELSERLFLIV